MIELHARVLAGHFGRDKTIAIVEDYFFWSSLKKHVAHMSQNIVLVKQLKVESKIWVYILLFQFPMFLEKTLSWTLC